MNVIERPKAKEPVQTERGDHFDRCERQLAQFEQAILQADEIPVHCLRAVFETTVRKTR